MSAVLDIANSAEAGPNSPTDTFPSSLSTIRSCLKWTEQYLSLHQEANPRLAAQWLVATVTGLDRIGLFMHFDQPLTEDELLLLQQTIQRRLRGEPLQYISGRAAFRYIELAIQPGVLIPRPETEMLVDLVLSAQPDKILEIGCGSGAITLSLLKELPGVTVVATDISPQAVATTRQNAALLKLDDPTRLIVIEDDLATSLLDKLEMVAGFDAIVSNPPYIPQAALAMLPQEIIDYEPLLALDGGDDGLSIYRRLLEQSVVLLRPGGLLAVELHETNVTEAASLAATAGFRAVDTHFDLTGRLRFLTAMK
ncbi:MAG: peptide chain release factor N(5)-glutamine methyltransferase [Coriobacteriales bacterium]|jgi:release factor glutamine methyltransferase|nr:peptide chain release factor N(5)-glutamine methyltransferase [Coriobacteriales bacterium]